MKRSRRTTRGHTLSAAMAVMALAASALAGPASAAPYFSPGYKGNVSFRNVTPAPLAPIALGTGKYPNLVVDRAGTAHIVYARDGGASAPDTLAFCNLQRGIKTCASQGVAPNPQAPDSSQGGAFSGNFPAGNHDFDGPLPLVIANRLFVVERRFPDVFSTPAGTSDSNVFEWSSVNGGATITGPGVIGDNQMAGGAIAFGDPSAPSIGTISRTETGGTFFQGVGPGEYTTDKAQLGSGDQAYFGGLAVDGTNPIAAFADLSGNVFVRECACSGSADPNDVANWSESSFRGFSPQIIGGPAGVFVLYSDSRNNGGTLRLRRIVKGQPVGATVTLGRSASEPAISEDLTGAISFAYTDSQGVWTRTSSNGVDFSPAEFTASIPRNGSIGHLVIAATADGGGFVSFVRNPSGAEGVGKVIVAAFGDQHATGQPGLGSLPGGGIGSAVGDQLATSTCQTDTFGVVEARITVGCYGPDPQNPNLDVTLGELNLNGLRIIPDQGTRIGIDPHAHTIDSTGKVRVLLTAGNLDITLWHEALHIQVPDDGPGDTLVDLKDFTGQIAPVVQGFPVNGDIDIKLANGGVDIPISLTLPQVFGGVTGSATLHASYPDGLELSSLEFKVGDANLGALEFKDIDVSYELQGDDWKGSGELLVPAGGGAFDAKLAIEFAGGDLKSASLDVGLPYPGFPLDDSDPPPELYLSHAGLGLSVNPLTVTGMAGLGLFPLKPPLEGGPTDYAFRLEGQLSVAFGTPVTITATAQGFLYTVNLADATLVYKVPDQVSLTGSAGFGDSGDLLQFDGKISAIIDPMNKVYGASIRGDVSVKGIKLPIEPAFAINNKGFAIYIPVGTIPIFPFIFASGSVSYNWGDTAPSISTGDVTGQYTAGIPGAAPDVVRAHAAAAMSFTVPAHAPTATIRVHGSGGPPQVALFAPGGQQVALDGSPTSSGERAGAVTDPTVNTTYVGILHPRPGRWTVAEASGSQIPIVGLEYAIGESSPTVGAKVSGSGFKRTLRYHATLPRDVALSFAERNGGLLHVIGRGHGGSGTIRFRPAFGPSGRRQLIAELTVNGLPLPDRTLASFSVPKPPKPGRAGHLRIKSTGRTFTFSFRPPSNAAHVLVRIVASDGRHLQEVVSPRTRGGSVPVIGFRDGITVTVIGVGADGSRGPPVTASARRKK